MRKAVPVEKRVAVVSLGIISIQRSDTIMRKAVPVEKRVAVVSGNQHRLSHHWASVWSFQGNCVYFIERSLCSYC